MSICPHRTQQPSSPLWAWGFLQPVLLGLLLQAPLGLLWGILEFCLPDPLPPTTVLTHSHPPQSTPGTRSSHDFEALFRPLQEEWPRRKCGGGAPTHLLTPADGGRVGLRPSVHTFSSF